MNPHHTKKGGEDEIALRRNPTGVPVRDGDLADLLEMHDGTIVILDRVRVDPRFRGHGIGPLLAATALWTFRYDCCVMAWAKVGFQPFRGGVWIMDPATTVQGNARQRLLDGET